MAKDNYQSNIDKILELPNSVICFRLICKKGNYKRFYKFQDKDKYLQVRDYRLSEGWKCEEDQYYEVI